MKKMNQYSRIMVITNDKALNIPDEYRESFARILFRNQYISNCKSRVNLKAPDFKRLEEIFYRTCPKTIKKYSEITRIALSLRCKILGISYITKENARKELEEIRKVIEPIIRKMDKNNKIINDNLRKVLDENLQRIAKLDECFGFNIGGKYGKHSSKSVR